MSGPAGPQDRGGAGRARYHFSYGPSTPYARAVELIGRWRLPDGEVVVDLGCGFGAIAEPVRELGLSYLGVDLDETGLDSLRRRGAEAIAGDLGTPDALVRTLIGALGGRRVAAFSALDAIEHLPGASTFLEALRRVAGPAGTPPLVVSIPNVSHRDVGIKLLLGRWDVTPTGLLDETHVRFFAPSTLDATMRASGWEELDANDFPLEASDQHFPADAVALDAGTPLGALLRQVRESAAPGATTNQFVRAYRPAAPGRRPSAGTPEPEGADAPEPRPFLTVVVRASGSDGPALDETLRALADHARDTEVVVVVASVYADPPAAPAPIETRLGEIFAQSSGAVRVLPFVPAPRDGLPLAAAADAGVQSARGLYVALLDEGDVPAPGWVPRLAEAAARAPGAVVLPAGPGMPAELAGLLSRRPASIAGAALPRSVFADLGLRVADHVAGCPEWHLLLRAVGYCGAISPGEGELVRGRTGATADVVSRSLHDQVLAALDAEPILFGRGSASLLAWLGAAEKARADAEARIAALTGSTSWRVTAPLRAATAWWRTQRTGHGA